MATSHDRLISFCRPYFERSKWRPIPTGLKPTSSRADLGNIKLLDSAKTSGDTEQESKAAIAELEALLSSTQGRLEDALINWIESLTAEVERLQRTSGSRPTALIQTTLQKQQVLELPTCTERGVVDRAESGGIAEQTVPTPDASTTGGALPTMSTLLIYKEPSVVIPERVSSGLQKSREASTQALARKILPAPGFDPNNDCALLSPPSVGESTIPCREAYSIIKDRISPEFDLHTVAEWLKPGFRWAIVPGAGCRVQTHMLFAFVDRITSI